LIVDFESQELLYGDSFGHPISADMHAVIDWWTHYHTNSRFTIHSLPVSRQQDSFSCGMLAWDALRHRLMPRAPTLMDPQQPFHERADIFLQLTMAYHKDKVSQAFSTCRSNLPTHFQNLESGMYRLGDSPPSPTHSHGVEVKSLKRSTSNELSTSSASPIKRPCTKSVSSIRAALQDNERKQHQPGLLRYFNKATEEEHRIYLARTDEEMKSRMDDTLLSAERAKLYREEKRRRYEKEKKRCQRAKLRNQEIMRGLRSPGGTKRRVKKSFLIVEQSELIGIYQVCKMELQETPKLDQGGTTAELTRPARSLKKKFKNEIRKPQGRKAFHTEKKVKYHNWFTPFVFKQIENARIEAGGPNWSTRAIERELKKKDPIVFKDFRRQTLDEWIDRSQAKPRWSDKTLARIKRGNDIGHANGGRKVSS